MERLTSSSDPASDTPSAGSVVDGFPTATADQIGGNWGGNYSYNSYGDLIAETQTLAGIHYQRHEHYDTLGRSSGYRLQRGTQSPQQLRYDYDAQGRLQHAAFKHKEQSWQQFTYSYLAGTTMLRELIHAELGHTGYAYHYDNIGNRTTALEDTTQTLYSSNANNQYDAVGRFEPQYDADGNQTQLQSATGIWSVEYNAENRPVKFTSAEGDITVECTYDHMGRRASKKVERGGELIRHEAYIYRGPAAIPSEVSSGALVSNRSAICLQIAAESLLPNSRWPLHYIAWDPTEPTSTRPLAIEKAGTWYSYGLDLSKNVTELYTAEGTLATSYSYSPFGAVSTSTPPPVKNPLQWSSEIYDDELALTYYNYRHYNPADGRWINRDPIAEEGGLNLYGFVGNQVWLWDITGKKGCCGPDITEWLIYESNVLYNWSKDLLKRIKKPRSIFSRLPGLRTYHLAESSRENIRIHQIMFSIESQLTYAPDTMFQYENCPSKDCYQTVTLDGKCVHTSEIGNFIYGLFIAALNINYLVGEVGAMYGNRGERTDADVFSWKLGYLYGREKNNNDYAALSNILRHGDLAKLVSFPPI